MFADPVKILRDFGIADSLIVADLGAGSGFYTIPAGHMAHNGKVYAVDVQKDFLTTLKTKAKDSGLKNVETIWGDIEKKGGTKLADGVVDVVILSNVLFLIQNKKKVIEEAHRILKKGGRVLLVDFSHDTSLAFSRHKDILKTDHAHKLFEDTNFKLDRHIPKGEHYYGMIFKKQ